MKDVKTPPKAVAAREEVEFCLQLGRQFHAVERVYLKPQVWASKGPRMTLDFTVPNNTSCKEMTGQSAEETEGKEKEGDVLSHGKGEEIQQRGCYTASYCRSPSIF